MNGGGTASSDPVARFAEAAERYCAWAETTPTARGREETHTACVLILDLLRTSVDLPESEQHEPAPPDVEDAEWRTVFARFETMSAPRLYATVEPTAPDQGVVWCDLHEDLADLWRDVRECLALVRDGHTGAGIHHWRFRFELYCDVDMTRMLHVLLPGRRGYG